MKSARSAFAFAALALAALVPASDAGAYATVGPSPVFSTSSSLLPDGRVYELVTPANKHGYQAGGTDQEPEFSVATADGDGVSFSSVGPAADTNTSGLSGNFVAERTSEGWQSRATTARGLRLNESFSLFAQKPHYRDYTPDLSHFAYTVNAAEVAEAPPFGGSNIYLMGSEPLAEPTWLFSGVVGPASEPGNAVNSEVVGMSPDASIVYIAFPNQLLAQDSGRSGWGIYEYRDGTLTEAGVLPDGSVPATGALPVATATENSGLEGHYVGENTPTAMDNQVSGDGRRIFFVAEGQVYVHETEGDGSQRTVLVSASQLPGHAGEAAPDGVSLFENPAKNSGGRGTYQSAPTYAYASPDGSHVVFVSEDQLTSQAPAALEPKTYDFDVDSGALEYLPSVSLGGVVAMSQSGSSFAFVNAATSPRELDLWSAGAGGGAITAIAQLPGGGFVGPGRFAGEDSKLIFQASAPIAGFNDAGGEQIYRYDLGENELDCVSCPPTGVQPSGSAYLSAVDAYDNPVGASVVGERVVNDARGVSSNGDRIFFDTPDGLVGRDTNGLPDVYEWEDGTIFLISSGTSPDPSWFLDNGESGNDVFLATSEELQLGDNDQGYDVYDARVPRPGDTKPPPPLPCSGDVCQGPPSIAQLLGPPPSALFNGTANVVEAPVAVVKSKVKSVSRSRLRANALKVCRKVKAKHQRAKCEQKVRRRYRTAGASSRRNGGRGK